MAKESKEIHPRHVIAIDGEGMDVPGTATRVYTDQEGKEQPTGLDHIYTLLVMYDSRYSKARYIEDWTHGLSTERIFTFLTSRRNGHYDICAAFHFNYDVTMWLMGLSETEKTTLWQSGWLVWLAPDKRYFYIRYIPSKLFFVGEYDTTMGLDCDIMHWPHDKPHILIYDVSGFDPRSFVRVMKEWDIAIDLDSVGAMKEKRGSFQAHNSGAVTDYCIAECVGLADYVRALDTTFQQENIFLTSWHGGGALANYFLRKHSINQSVRDSFEENPGLKEATLKAYFGGRIELFRMGHLQNIHDYDIQSAYPYAATLLPNLKEGHWKHYEAEKWCSVGSFEEPAPYALYHVRWNIGGQGRRVTPLPFRWKSGVYWADNGTGWFHSSELHAALQYFDRRCFNIVEGWVYTPDDRAARPLDFIHNLAEMRLRYKASGDRRATPYKLGLNSLYGKFAQHSYDEDKTPPYQCYYAAGFITAYTRSRLLDFTFQPGYDDSDIIMYATDGVFCLKERPLLQEGFGGFEYAGKLDDTYLVQPGCWFDSSGHARTRGFHQKSLDYQAVRNVWNSQGVDGVLNYVERRFSGLGHSAGLGTYNDYARWVDENRQLKWYPERKFIGKQYGDSLDLIPYQTPDGTESEVYVPASIRDQRGAIMHLENLVSQLEEMDQPDL